MKTDVVTRNKEVKRILLALYGRENVSVRNGRGTSWGWCDVDITIKRPADCSCEPEGFYCDACKKLLHTTRIEAETALKDVEFYKYPDDMGGDNKELLIQVHIAR